MEISFIICLNSLKQFVPWRKVNFYTSNTLSVFASLFKLDIDTANFTAVNEGIQREKAALNSPFGERPELHMQLYQTNEQAPKTSKRRFNFTYDYFPLTFIRQTSAVGVVVLKRACAFFSYAISNWHESNCVKVCLEAF